MELADWNNFYYWIKFNFDYDGWIIESMIYAICIIFFMFL
jgi:hypothetical protein